MLDQWINAFYLTLNGFGFPDPIHAIMVHIPMGLIIGACCFAWIAALSPWKKLATTAYHCITLAFLFLFPTLIFGIMDWRHFYVGAWLTPIKIKMVLAAVVLILSFTAFLLGFTGKESSKTILFLYTLCVITIVGLGWFGARLVYGGQTQASSIKYESGKKIFMANCNSCHINGGNKTRPDHPLRNSDTLESLNAFLAQIRHPEEPMPAFPASRISDKDAKQLYDYIVNEINCPGRTGKVSP